MILSRFFELVFFGSDFGICTIYTKLQILACSHIMHVNVATTPRFFSIMGGVDRVKAGNKMGK